jgi:hypothetical protein
MIDTRTRWAGNVAQMGEKRKAYITLVGKPDGKRLIGKPKHRWVDNIKMDLSDRMRYGMDWTDLAQDMDQWRAFLHTVINLRVP